MNAMQDNTQLDDRWLTIQELMEYIPLSEKTLRKIAKELHAVRISGRGKLMIKKSEFDTWLTEHSRSAAESANPQAIKVLKAVFGKAK
jgi:excisionase family DNA binding protein